MQITGIQIDKPFLKMALIKKERGRIELCSLKSVLMSEPNHVKQLYTSFPKGPLVSGLSAKEILIRSIELKIGDSRHLREALEFHSQATTHLNPSEMISVPHLLKKNNQETEALLFTASKDILKSHLLELQKFTIDPDRVSAYSMALIRYLQWKAPLLKDAFIIDLGFHEWTCALMEKGELKKSYSLLNGMEALLTSLWEDRKKILLPKEIEGVAKQIDLLQLKSHFNPNLSEKINEMRQELTKIIFSFHRLSHQQPLIFTGHVDGFGHLPEFLIENFKDAVILPDSIEMAVEEKKYAIPIGLGLEQAHDSLQFLQGEFFPKKNWRKVGFYSLLLASASLILSLSIFFIGMTMLHARKEKMIAALELALDQWDPELKQSIFSQSSDEEAILTEWISTVAKCDKEYPYILKAPKMSDVLLWFTLHPFLKESREMNEPIEIQELRYQLVQCPMIDSPHEPYQTKVEIEFKTQNPMNARKFRELLLKGDAMIDAGLGIEWEVLDASYRTSFFLKNKVFHVS